MEEEKKNERVFALRLCQLPAETQTGSKREKSCVMYRYNGK